MLPLSLPFEMGGWSPAALEPLWGFTSWRADWGTRFSISDSALLRFIQLPTFPWNYAEHSKVDFTLLNDGIPHIPGESKKPHVLCSLTPPRRPPNQGSFAVVATRDYSGVVGRWDLQVPLLDIGKEFLLLKTGSSLLMNTECFKKMAHLFETPHTILLKGNIPPKRTMGIALLNWASRVKPDKGENSGIATCCYSFFSSCFLKRVKTRNSGKWWIMMVENDRNSPYYCDMQVMTCHFSPLPDSFPCVLQHTKLKIRHCVQYKNGIGLQMAFHLCNPRDSGCSNIGI